MKNNEIPSWACKNYGDYEHDWLDCYKCIEKYENWLEHDKKCPQCGSLSLYREILSKNISRISCEACHFYRNVYKNEE